LEGRNNAVKNDHYSVEIGTQSTWQAIYLAVPELKTSIEMKKLLLPVLLVLSQFSNSQSYTAGTHYNHYHDVFPDSLLYYTVAPYSHKTYSLNIFGTGNDIMLTAHGAVSSGGSGAYINVTSLNPDVYIRFGRWDSVWVPGNSNWNVTKVAKPLMSGDVINAAGAMWDNTMLYLTDQSGSGGGNKNVRDFVGGDKFIGLKFININNYNNAEYGWIWVRCGSMDSCYVKEYSRNSLPVGINEIERYTGSIYPNPVTDHFYVSGVVDRSSFTLTDVSGRNIPVTSAVEGNGLRVSLQNVSTGIYFLRYNTDSNEVTKKIVKTN
jgi:hypothetical protein